MKEFKIKTNKEEYIIYADTQSEAEINFLYDYPDILDYSIEETPQPILSGKK